MDALKDIPIDVERIETETGIAYLQKTDIFKRLMWFAYKNSTTFHPLKPERVKEISLMNKAGQKPADLGAVQLAPAKEKQEEKEAYVDLVGQVTLNSLEKKSKKKKKHKHRRPGQGGGAAGGQRDNQRRPPRPRSN